MPRPRGSRNKKTQVWLDKISESGQTPVEFLLDRFRDPDEDLSVRIDCAKAAAPYCHPKIMAIAHANLTSNGEETESIGLSRVSEILDELIGSRITSDNETLVSDRPVLPAEIRSEQVGYRKPVVVQSNQGS
jgi:hypothetical protein